MVKIIIDLHALHSAITADFPDFYLFGSFRFVVFKSS